MEIIFVRHSITGGNEERRFNGVTDDALSAAGIALAEQRAAVMPEVRHVYVSPLARCRQTAGILWPDVPKTVVDGLREMDFGPFEGKNHSELTGMPVYDEWIRSGGTTYVQGLETIEECAERAVAALRFVLENAGSSDKIAVVSHGGALACIMLKLGRPERADYYDWMVKNCSGYVMQVEKAPFSLHLVRELGDV